MSAIKICHFEQLTHFSAKLWLFFFEEYKEKGEWNWKAKLRRGSGFKVKVPWPEKHLNAAEEIIHTVHVNKGPGSVFILNKI